MKLIFFTPLTHFGVCSASVDKSVRVWTLGGKYIGTLGTFLPWNEIPSYEPPPDYLEIKLPADIKRVASWTTLKVRVSGSKSNLRLVMSLKNKSWGCFFPGFVLPSPTLTVKRNF